MINRHLVSIASATVLVLVPVIARAAHDQNESSAQVGEQGTSTESVAAKEVLALDEQMEDLLRSNSEARIALWADDLVYITNRGAVMDKARVAKQVSTDQVHVGSLEVTERKVRAYGDVAVVTALEHMRASFHGKEARDLVQRYTRIWARRGKWQIVSFQATGVTDGPLQTAGFEACAAPDGPATAESIEQTILRLEDEHSEAAIKGDSAKGNGWLGDDYIGINGRGRLYDKPAVAQLYRPGSLKYRFAKHSDRRVRVYGSTAIVTGTWCFRQRREGEEELTSANRITRVWVKRNGKWDVVSWQGTPIVPAPDFAPGSTPEASDDANRSEDEAAIRKLIADHNEAFDRHDGTAITYFTDDADTRNIVGEFFTGKAEIEELNVALNKNFANAKRTETIKRIRFLTPDIALVDSSGEWTGYIIAGNGDKLQPGKGGMSFKVVVKKEGRWLITAMRNATPAPPRPPFPGSSLGPGTPNPQAQEPLISTDDANRAQDEALRKKVADGDDAWNRRDVSTFLANARFAENCDHISVAGNWLSGKAQVEKVFQTPTVSIHRTIERIRFITPEVAVLVVRSTYTRDNRSWDAMSIAVQHKINGQWWAESFQNTLVKSREEAIAQAARASSPMAQTEPEVITPANSKMDFSGDVAVIRKMIAEDVDGWNRRDPKFVTAHGSENHDHINVIGAWRQGKAETEKAMTAALATTRNNINMFIAKIRFITADVAIVIVRNEYTNDKETLKSISTSILHKVNGEWWNEAFQNTYVRPPAADTTRDQKLPENN